MATKTKAAGFKIQSVVAFLVVNADGDEGVIGFRTGEGWMPAICADQGREDLVEDAVRRATAGTGKLVRKVRFSTRIEEGAVR